MKNLIIIILFFGLIQPQLAHSQNINPDFVDGRLYVKVLNNSTIDLAHVFNQTSALNQMKLLYGVTDVVKAFQTDGVGLSKVYRVEFNRHNAVNALIDLFATLPYIEFAEKAPLYHLQYTPDDANANTLYHLELIDAYRAWDIHKGESKIVIAIIDNGINITHEDLAESIWLNEDEIPNNILDDDLNGFRDDYFGYDVSDMDGNPNPPFGGASLFGHGTHCAGIAGAKSNNGIGLASIGFNAKIMAIKATSNASTGNYITHGYEAADYALKNGASVISMSFGSTTPTLTWQLIIQQAELFNVILVAAAGNNNTEFPNYPAAFPEVISVGATNELDQKAEFSNFGSTIDVMAPGTGIYSTFYPEHNDYSYLSGTSMSCPMVAGLISLIKSYNPAFTNAQVKAFLYEGCENITSKNMNYIGKIGAGRIDAYKTMMLVSGQTSSLGLNNLENASFLLFPNPTNDKLNIALKDQSIEGLQVFDVQGKLIKEVDLKNSNSPIISIDVTSFDKGVYFIKSRGNSSETQKFIVQ